MTKVSEEREARWYVALKTLPPYSNLLGESSEPGVARGIHGHGLETILTGRHLDRPLPA